MKVLKKGNPQKGWATKRTCTGEGNGGGGCEAELLVEEADVYETRSSCMGESESHVTFKCPECGVETDLPWGQVPSRVTDRMPRAKR